MLRGESGHYMLLEMPEYAAVCYTGAFRGLEVAGNGDKVRIGGARGKIISALS